MLPADRDAEIQPRQTLNPKRRSVPHPRDVTTQPDIAPEQGELIAAIHHRPGGTPTPRTGLRNSGRSSWAERRARSRQTHWLQHLKLGGIATIATGLSFWGGITVSTQGVHTGLSIAMPYDSVVTSLDTLPVLASEAWLQQMKAVEAQQRRLDFPVPAAFRSQVIHDIRLPSNKKVIALTFDDGPSEPYTNNILYILNNYGVKATFFLLGQNVQAYPARAQQIHEQGHAIANHSWSHPYQHQSPSQAAAQIDNTNAWIERTTGVKAKFFRPPGGYLNTGLADYAKHRGQTVVMWSADSKDYYASSAQITRFVLAQARPGGIVLMHDGGGDRRRTIAALPGIITALQQQGYSFVTLPELMTMYEQETQATATQPTPP